MIILEDGSHKDQIFDMWQRNFHDPLLYAQYYFSNVYGKNDILLDLKEDNLEEDAPEKDMNEKQMRGMLHLNPYVLRIHGIPMNAHYIVGVATDEEYRRQGVMRKLLQAAFLRMYQADEAFTYLMPADENYYLPFDFRFGMKQVEQEVEFHENQDDNIQYDFTHFSEEMNIADMENEVRNHRFSIHTEISLLYYKNMKQEAASEFGQTFFGFMDGKYMGRAVVSAENDYLVLAQLYCMDQEKYDEFLKQLLMYCEKSYHYGKYQIIADMTWENTLHDIFEQEASGDNPHEMRIMAEKTVKIIMFRILNPAKLGEFLHSTPGTKECSKECNIYIKDSFFHKAQGTYHFSVNDQGCKIEKISDTCKDADGGSITIADFTSCIFGTDIHETDISRADISGADIPGKEGLCLTSKGRQLLDSMEPLNKNCIMEIV